MFTASLAADRIARLLRLAGGIGMIIVSCFMIYRGVRSLTSGIDGHSHCHEGKSRSAVMLGFLSGLVPCSYGWAPLMMILTIGRLSMIPLIVVPFSFGISTFLALLAAGAVLLRSVVVGFFTKAQRSGLVSGLLLLVFSAVFVSSLTPLV